MRDENDAVLNYMISCDIPISRKAYLELAYLGQPPELDAEAEEELPDLIRNLLPEPRAKQ